MKYFKFLMKQIVIAINLISIIQELNRKIDLIGLNMINRKNEMLEYLKIWNQS